MRVSEGRLKHESNVLVKCTSLQIGLSYEADNLCNFNLLEGIAETGLQVVSGHPSCAWLGRNVHADRLTIPPVEAYPCDQPVILSEADAYVGLVSGSTCAAGDPIGHLPAQDDLLHT